MTDMVTSWLCGNIKLGTLTWRGDEQRALNNVTQALCDIRPPGRQSVTSNTSQHTGPPRYDTLSMTHTASETVYQKQSSQRVRETSPIVTHSLKGLNGSYYGI